MRADLALINGNILTLNPVKPGAEAVAIKKDRIVGVGSNREVGLLVGEGTEVVDLGGRTVVPGFVDSHIHVVDFGKVLAWIDLTDVKSIGEMQGRLKERVKKIPKGRWVVGNGWNHERFVEKRYPNRFDLDEVSLDNHVVFYHQCGRVCVVNSKALELAGVTEETVAPSGGEIERDAGTGELTGVFRENATDLVWKAIPEASEEELAEAACLACEKIVEAGVTDIHWIVTSPVEISVIKRLGDSLPLRVHVIVAANIWEQLKVSGSLPDGNWGVKVFVDGSLAARTAALKEPYLDDPTNRGELLYSQQELDALVSRAHRAGCRLVMHAMGDRAIEAALDAVEKALKEKPMKNHGYRLEHASVLNRKLIARIKKVGLTVSVQPKCAITEFSVWSAVERLGPERARLLYPFKTLIDEGILVVGGSDCPMEPLSPLEGIQAAVTRQYFPEEQISVDEALKMYTVNAAKASSEENIKGTVEEGKLADLTVLSGDPRTVQPNKIGDITVYMTVVGGKIVYQK